jgi:hypothetical protein
MGVTQGRYDRSGTISYVSNRVKTGLYASNRTSFANSNRRKKPHEIRPAHCGPKGTGPTGTPIGRWLSSSLRGEILGLSCTIASQPTGDRRLRCSAPQGPLMGCGQGFNISEGVRHRFIEGHNLPLVPRSGPCQLTQTLTRAGRRALVESTVRRGADWSACGL